MNSLALSILLTFWLASSVIASERYSFGVVPQQAASKLVRSWNPVFKHIERQTGIKLLFATKRNISTFENACASGDYDFVYMNPYHYIQFHGETGYRPMAKARDKKIKGIIVVKKDSDIHSLEELSGKTLAFASYRAFGASLVPRTALKKKGIRFTSKYVGSHDTVYYNIATGNFIAGGGVMRTLEATSDNVRKRLRVLWVSPGYTPHAFAVHARVPNTIVSKVKQALINLDKTDEGKILLDRLKIKGIEAAKNSDWDDVRKLKF